MSPTTNQLFAANFIAVAAEFTTLNFGVALVAPVEITVVVPGVTAPMVGWPAPVIHTK
jgi:hypothetical protein